MDDPDIPLSLLLIRTVQNLVYLCFVIAVITVGFTIVLAIQDEKLSRAVLVPLITLPTLGLISATLAVHNLRSRRWVPYFSRAMLACSLFCAVWGAVWAGAGATAIDLTLSKNGFDPHGLLVGAVIGFVGGAISSFIPRDKKLRYGYG